MVSNPVDMPVNPGIQDLLDHWRNLYLQNDGALPHRQQVDPLAFRSIIGWVAFLQVERDPFDMRYLMVGERLATLFGKDLKGLRVSEAFSSFWRKNALDAYRKVAETGEPLVEVVRFPFLPDRFSYHRAMLPLKARPPSGGEAGTVPDLVMLALQPLNPSLQRVEDWMFDADVQRFLNQLDEADKEKLPKPVSFWTRILRRDT